MRIGPRRRLVQEDQVVMSYRDSKTNILFTWSPEPGEPVKIWLPYSRKEYSVQIHWNEQRLAEYMSAAEAGGWVLIWGHVVGVFYGVVEGYLERRLKGMSDGAIIQSLSEVNT